MDTTAPKPLTAAELVSRVLYRDGLVLVIDKPAGLPVHAGPRGGDNLEALFDALRFGLPRPPSLAHRLDRDTSGCLVLGRHRKALARLGRLFSAGRVEKTYWAVVEGGPSEESGRIDAPLAKQNARAGWRMTVDPAGQSAVTDWQVLGRADGRTWLALYPRTGRTHQIRVHCAAMGWPLLGEPIYRTTPRDGVPLHLHARAISLPLYPAKPAIEATAPVPPHMRAALDAFGFRETAQRGGLSGHSQAG
jgi:tRNA pseudouridine32 synthase/23S rRNA pseudouridine746 synthase/23S rRNA pseudouridine1911/1915/1917 synthase